MIVRVVRFVNSITCCIVGRTSDCSADLPRIFFFSVLVCGFYCATPCLGEVVADPLPWCFDSNIQQGVSFRKLSKGGGGGARLYEDTSLIRDISS